MNPATMLALGLFDEGEGKKEVKEVRKMTDLETKVFLKLALALIESAGDDAKTLSRQFAPAMLTDAKSEGDRWQYLIGKIIENSKDTRLAKKVLENLLQEIE